MKVKELIQLLSECDPNMVVAFYRFDPRTTKLNFTTPYPGTCEFYQEYHCDLTSEDLKEKQTFVCL